MKNKKGAEMAIGTIVIIVLALVVLVILVLGFTSGWGNLWGRITSFFGGGNNVDSVVQACGVACSTQATYDYCTRVRTVKQEGKPDIPETCEKLAEEHKALGFQECDNSALNCPVPVCANTNGSAANTVPCTCGNIECDLSKPKCLITGTMGICTP